MNMMMQVDMFCTDIQLHQQFHVVQVPILSIIELAQIQYAWELGLGCCWGLAFDK